MHYLYYTGFNVETITYKNVNFTAWDVGGRDKIVSSAQCLGTNTCPQLTLILGAILTLFKAVDIILWFIDNYCIY